MLHGLPDDATPGGSGEFTPPSETGSIEYPGDFGGFNWGGASINPANGYAYLNDNRLPIMITLKPAEEVQRIIAARGKELWQGRLPVGSGSTPMSYVSPKTGKQYVLISAGGARDSPVRGDHVVAYALEESR